jgi:hypothetical protein
MRPDTLASYLDCRSDSDFYRKCKALESLGYPGPDPVLGRHIKERVDGILAGGKGLVEEQKGKKSQSAAGGRAVTAHLSPEEAAKKRKEEMLKSIRNGK